MPIVMAIVTCLAGAACRFVFGCLQSLLFGLIVGRWDGGHGIAWGGMVAIVSAGAGLLLGWHGIAVAAGLSGTVFVLHLLALWRDAWRHR